MKINKFVMGLLFLLFVPVMGLFAQVVTPESWSDLYANYGTFFATYLGIAGIATFVGEYVIRLLNVTVKFQKVAMIVLLSVGAAFLGMWLNVGFLAEATWWETLLWGGLASAAASGLRSGNLLFAKTIVDFVIGLIKQKEAIA